MLRSVSLIIVYNMSLLPFVDTALLSSVSFISCHSTFLFFGCMHSHSVMRHISRIAEPVNSWDLTTIGGPPQHTHTQCQRICRCTRTHCMHNMAWVKYTSNDYHLWQRIARIPHIHVIIAIWRQQRMWRRRLYKRGSQWILCWCCNAFRLFLMLNLSSSRFWQFIPVSTRSSVAVVGRAQWLHSLYEFAYVTPG